MFNIGLTGGIGSGKTCVANFFSDCGACIIDADHIAHQITQIGKPAFKTMVQHFDSPILKSNGALDRAALRQLIFSHPNEKQWLENLLHPIILQTMLTQAKQSTGPFNILVIPLLAESPSIDFLDRICVVDAPAHLQLKRVQQRDQTGTAEIQKIMDSQAQQALRLAIADDVIVNDQSLDALKQRVTVLYQQYLDLAEDTT